MTLLLISLRQKEAIGRKFSHTLNTTSASHIYIYIYVYKYSAFLPITLGDLIESTQPFMYIIIITFAS